jgi:hypothetical protein
MTVAGPAQRPIVNLDDLHVRNDGVERNTKESDDDDMI